MAVDKVTASIDKNPVVQGQSFILTVTADDSIDASALDTSPLLKDFVVGRTSTSTQTRMVNGSTNRQTKWTTVLVPQNTGKFIIPAFNIDGIKSAPIAVVVTKQSEKSAKQQDIYITAETSNKAVYVQQQMTLTIKLHVGVALEGGSLSDPKMEDANITQLGQDNQTEEIINGRRFQVIERKYAVSPQKSGEFKLETPIFSGQVSMPSQRRSGLFGFNQSKPVSVISEPLTVKVKPQPQSFQGQWLPSELFTIHEEWQPTANEFMVGNPITRTITITAAGIAKEQLPQLILPTTQGLKIYPDQPVLHGGINGGRLVSQAVANFAVVASSAGTFKLPEIRIPWWNTVTNKQEYAVLPEKTITVKANPEFTSQAKSTPTLQQETTFTNENSTIETVIVKEKSWLQWLFLSLWIVTSVLWLLTAWSSRRTKAVTETKLDVNKPYLSLLAACKQNNGQQALLMITPWINSIYKDKQVNHLAEALAAAGDDALTEAINQLQQTLYAKDRTEWQGNQLAKAIQKLNKSKQSSMQESNLTLNP